MEAGIADYVWDHEENHRVIERKGVAEGRTSRTIQEGGKFELTHYLILANLKPLSEHQSDL